MTELLTAAQMRAIEQAAIASGEVTGLELMERAGKGVVKAIFEEWPELAQTSHRAVVLCGPGNNGGDGFVVARLLKESGWEVEVFLYGDPERMPPDARVNYERWRGMGEARSIVGLVETHRSREEYEAVWRVLEASDVVIDAVFGIGFSGHRKGNWSFLNGDAHRCIEDRPDQVPFSDGRKWVAVDVPSGLCSDSGVWLTPGNANCNPIELKAHLTVTFHRPKLGHYLEYGEYTSRHVVVADIGLRTEQDEWWDNPHLRKAEPVRRVDGAYKHFVLGHDLLAKKRFGGDHKYTHGHALILSGPPGRTGAARLAARGALRIGAGLVTVAAAPGAIPEHAAQLNAIMLRPVADAAALQAILADGRINALCIGPALGLDDRARGLVGAALGLLPDAPPPPSPPHEGEGSRGAPDVGAGPVGEGEALPLPLVGRGEGRGAPRRVVLDADALTLLARDAALFAALNENCVLTPHAGEFARLFPDIAEKLAAPATKGPAYSKVDATREAAKRAGCVVLYKGPDTVIADPSGRCSINSAHYDRAAPWLATAGSGDVLAGFITGLLARGFAPMQAAETAAWLHVECARKFGPGLIAEDLPEQLPAVFRDLGL